MVRYNQEVPLITPFNSESKQTAISPGHEGEIRPIGEQPYNDYILLQRLRAPSVKAFAHKIQVGGEWR